MIDNFRPRVVINPSPTPPTPTPTWNLLYRWYLNNSLVDTEQSEVLNVNDGGISGGGFSGCFTFPTGITLLDAGYAIEIDFANFEFDYSSNFDFIMINILELAGFTTNPPTTGEPWGFICGNNETQIIQNGTVDMFSNSTLRIEVSETANHNIIWTVKQDGTVIGGTPEYATDGVSPFFDYTTPTPPDIITTDCQLYDANNTGYITGLRIFQLSNNS